VGVGVGVGGWGFCTSCVLHVIISFVVFEIYGICL